MQGKILTGLFTLTIHLTVFYITDLFVTVNLKYIALNIHSGDGGFAYSLGKPITYHVPESPARIARNLNIQYSNALCARISHGMVHKITHLA